jgi:hypothetical protein
MERDSCGRNVIENLMLEASQRLKFMSYKIFNVATEAPTSEVMEERRGERSAVAPRQWRR